MRRFKLQPGHREGLALIFLANVLGRIEMHARSFANSAAIPPDRAQTDEMLRSDRTNMTVEKLISPRPCLAFRPLSKGQRSAATSFVTGGMLDCRCQDAGRKPVRIR